MRLVEEIPHHTFKISVFNYNAKYIIKIELAQFEQSYKIAETNVQGLDQVKQLLTESFLESCMKRFLSMRADFNHSFENLNYEV